MKKNIISMILAGLFLTTLVVLASNSSDVIPEEECVCLTPVSDTVRATSISLPSELHLNLHLQDSMLYQLKPVISPLNAQMDKIQWMSTSPTEVKVDQNGVLHVYSETLDGTCIIYAFMDGFYAEWTVYVEDYINYSYGGYDPEYVEIGGIKWGTKNVGASVPGDAGLYFAMYDVVGHYVESGWSWNQTYTLTDGVYEAPHTGGLSVRAGGANDAATAHLGADWIMPGYYDFEALVNDSECDYIAINGTTHRFEGRTDIKGIVAIHKDAPYYYHNQDYIGSEFLFFPFGGTRYGLDYVVSNPSYCAYMGRSINAATLFWYASQYDIYMTNYAYGQQVRPIYIGE